MDMSISHTLIAVSAMYVLASLPASVLVEYKTVEREETKTLDIHMDGFPESLKLIVPEKFTFPKTKKEKAEAAKNLTTMRQNKALRGNYTQVLMTNWEAWPGEMIFVYSLATLKKLQGNITSAEWEGIKASFEEMRVAQANERGRKSSESTQEISIRTNAVIVFGRTTKRGEHGGANVLTATKMMYHEGYVISTLMMIDEEKAESQEFIKYYASLLDFKI